MFAHSERLKHVSLVNARTSILKKQITIERRDPLIAHSERINSLLKTTRQVRKRQKRSSMNVAENDEKQSVIWGMFMSVTLESALFMGNNYLDNCHSIANTEDLTMKQMFDISEKLISEQSDEIYGVKIMNWEDYSWKYLSLTGYEQVISLERTKVYEFSDSVLCLGKMNENPQSNITWEDKLTWFKNSSEYRTLDRIDGEPVEFECNIFPGFNTLQLSHKSPRGTV